MSKLSSSEGSTVVHRIVYFLIQILLILAVIAFTPGLPPDTEFKSYKLNIKSISLNDKLNNAEKLFVDQLKGPEDFAIFKNELYTTTHGGYVQKISNGKLIPVVRFGKDCKGLFEEHICGRPLGLRFDENGTLYVSDAYYGIFKVNILTGAVTNIVSMTQPIDQVLPKIPNAIAVTPNYIYWTDSSTTHHLYDGFYTLLGNGNGRLIKYNIATKTNEVLLRNLHFPNGVAVSNDGSFLVVAESFKARLLKYHIKGEKTGQTEIFAELSGFPDNIDFSSGKFIVSLVATPDKVVQLLPEMPLLRKLISRLATLFEFVVDGIHALYPNDFFQKVNHMIGHFEYSAILSKPSAVIIQTFNEKGQLVDTFSATDNKINGISSIIKHQGYYYLGSPFNNYVARVKIV